MLVNVNLAAIEQGIYDELLQGLPTPTVVSIISLVQLLPRLNPQLWISGARRQALKDSAELIKKNMDAVRVPFTVQLGGAQVGMEELLNVQPGDVIRLEGLANQELDILVGGQRKFKGRPGLVGHKVAIQITGLHPES